MLHINIYFIILPKYKILRSASGATPQTLYHVSVASTSIRTTWLPDSFSMVCKLYLKTKDALCKLDGVLVSVQYKSKHIFYIDLMALLAHKWYFVEQKHELICYLMLLRGSEWTIYKDYYLYRVFAYF